MHISPLSYDEFTFFGDFTYEISKNQIEEKIIYLSICYFTLATEIRFLEMEDLKKQQFTNKYKQQNSQEQKLRISEVYHLKAIEIACKFVACKSPYIDHLVQSYHKHYYNSLEIIQEEEGSTMDRTPLKPSEPGDGLQHQVNISPADRSRAEEKQLLTERAQ